MFSESLFVTFLITATLYGYVPGPAMLYVAAQTSTKGINYGIQASLGIHIGTYVHVLAAAVGLSVLLHYYPQVYLGIKFAGALYLVWLGVGLFYSKPVNDEQPAETERARKRPLIEGLVVEVLNPKTGLFFVAFLPQFTQADSSAPSWLQFLVLGTIANFIFSSSDVMCALLANIVVKKLSHSSKKQVALRALAGCLLIALGVHLAFGD